MRDEKLNAKSKIRAAAINSNPLTANLAFPSNRETKLLRIKKRTKIDTAPQTAENKLSL